MIIKHAEFVKSSVELKQCPSAQLPEFAFIGRSNVGKSSLINMLTNKKGLAKTSATPGKTQAINHFKINKEHEAWYLVDLPGYGYAKSAKTNRKKWGEFIRDYLSNRANLTCTFVLIDYRLDPQKIDLEFMQWLGENAIPFVIVFTKCEKLGIGQDSIKFKKYAEALTENWESLPTCFFTSATHQIGKNEILNQIDIWRKETFN
ncbi:MAG: ribosome biogenesis GTP-binding protein YihA/YsxC [Bacteroidota bacterium]